MEKSRNNFKKGKIIEGWKIKKFLGSGRSVEAYHVSRASAPKHEGTLVIAHNEQLSKELNKSIDLMNKIKHKNIAKILDSRKNIYDGRTICVREYASQTLDDLMDDEGKMDFKLSTNLMIQALDGLSHLHSLNIVHKDIKPLNLMVHEDRLFIIDVGVIKNNVAMKSRIVFQEQKKLKRKY